LFLCSKTCEREGYYCELAKRWFANGASDSSTRVSVGTNSRVNSTVDSTRAHTWVSVDYHRKKVFEVFVRRTYFKILHKVFKYNEIHLVSKLQHTNTNTNTQK